MRDSLYLSNILPASAVSIISAFGSSTEEGTFEQEARLAGLSPSEDFRSADLKNVDLTDSDLRGFDFSGADLRGATGLRSKWDETTNFDGASLDGSIFASKVRLKNFFDSNTEARHLFKSVSGRSWSEKILWAAENLRTNGRYHDFAIPITEAMFYDAQNDDFLQAELMRHLAPRMTSRDELRDMLIAAICDEPKAFVVVKTAMSMLKKQGLSDNISIRQHAFSLLKSRNPKIQEHALRFILNNAPTRQEIDVIKRKVADHGGTLPQIYVAEITRALGEKYEISTRDPSSNSAFSMNSVITSTDLRLIARRWLRAESSEREKDKNVPLIQRKGGLITFTQKQVEQKEDEIRKIYLIISSFGINVKVAPGRQLNGLDKTTE